MPYLSEKIKITGSNLDRRKKLTDDQKKEIKRLYKLGGTFRGLGRTFNVDRKTIKNIVNPDHYQRQLQLYRETKHSRKYYNRIKNTEAVKKTRNYKQDLYKKGLIKLEKDDKVEANNDDRS